MLTETWFFYKRNDEDLTGRLIAFDRRSRDSTAHTLTNRVIYQAINGLDFISCLQGGMREVIAGQVPRSRFKVSYQQLPWLLLTVL